MPLHRRGCEGRCVVAVRKDFENTNETKPLITLRYFGPEVKLDALATCANRKNTF
ncbi:MAG: hypothetical protein HYY24_15710 [Verrucomicrobia bacterium]|nr:hypothetical protein [Verrucomicrobiota bacterium]